MSVHALELRMPVGEIETSYGARPEGSHSKLSTFGDGWRILKTIGTLYRLERPVLFYGGIGALLLLTAIVLAIPLVRTYLQTGLVPRFPTAILATGMVIVAVSVHLCRPHPRHGHSWPEGSQAARLSVAARAVRSLNLSVFTPM